MKKIIFTALVCHALLITATAQQTDGQQMSKIAGEVKNIPLTGNKPEDFVPAGWEIYTRGEGDLNGDRLKDFAFNIVPPDESKDGSGCYDAAIILFAEKGGGLRRVGFNDTLSDNGFCGKQKISIEKGTVLSGTNFGNGYANDITFRFRYDRAAKALMLIGFDWESYTRTGNEDGFAVSYNLLTGEKKETKNYIDRRPNAQGVYDKQSVKRSRTERLQIKFDDAGYDLKNGIGVPVNNGVNK